MDVSQVTHPLRYGGTGAFTMWLKMTKRAHRQPMQPAFGERLKALRLERGWSEDEVESRCGVARQTVSRLERAETEPQVKTIKRLADLFGVKFAELAQTTSVAKLTTSDPSATLPVGLDIWLQARGYDTPKRIQDELKTAQIVFTDPPPPPDTDWISFYDKLAEALLALRRTPQHG